MEASFGLQLSFLAFPLALIAWATYLTRSRMVLFGFLGFLLFSAGLAWAGILSNFEALPPRMLLLLLPLTILTAFAAFRAPGTEACQLPWSWIIGFQAFRLPLEWMIHQAVEEGVAPPQMTWTGMNFDILTGMVSLALAPFATKLPTWCLWSWNLLGMGLLFNVVTVAVLSVPGPIQVLKPDNTWVAYFPFVWLPAICVMSALFGHVVATRKLLETHRDETNHVVGGP